MFSQLFVFVIATTLMSMDLVNAQRRAPFRRATRVHDDDNGERYGPPEPYDFTYLSEDEEGTHTHNQQGDANGVVTGEYTIQLADGRSRQVK